MREEGGRTVLDATLVPAEGAEQAIGPGGDLAGTPIYLAPEVFDGAPRSEASDIYSLGVLLFYLATAGYPVEGVTRTEVRRVHSENGPRRRLRDLRPDLPEPFVRVVERALATEPAHRFQTAGDFEAALAATLRQRQRTKAWVPVASPFSSPALSLPHSSSWEATGATRRPRRQQPARLPQPRHQRQRPTIASSVDVSGRHGRSAPAASGRARRSRQSSFLRSTLRCPRTSTSSTKTNAAIRTCCFPLPGSTTGPLPASLNTLPGVQGDKEAYWQVTTPGTREVFIIFASPRPLDDVARLVASLPPARFGAKVSHTPPPTESDSATAQRGWPGQRIIVTGSSQRSLHHTSR